MRTQQKLASTSATPIHFSISLANTFITCTSNMAALLTNGCTPSQDAAKPDSARHRSGRLIFTSPPSLWSRQGLRRFWTFRTGLWIPTVAPPNFLIRRQTDGPNVAFQRNTWKPLSTPVQWPGHPIHVIRQPPSEISLDNVGTSNFRPLPACTNPYKRKPCRDLLYSKCCEDTKTSPSMIGSAVLMRLASTTRPLTLAPVERPTLEPLRSSNKSS